jgi:hypothetical protein
MRYIVKEIPATTNVHGIELETGRSGSILNALEVYEIVSIWRPGVRDKRSASAHP